MSGDRKFKAEDMAAHFAKVLTNGVMPSGTQLQAAEDSGMNVTVSAGSAWINGYAYHNDSDYTLSFAAADGVLNRIDRIVVRWGRLARSINLVVIKGTSASSPAAPAIVRSADYYDLGVATVSIGKGITAITQAMITDTRLDSNVCGFVSSLIQPDTSGWFAQFDSAFNAALSGNQSEWATWFASTQGVFADAIAANQSDWDLWFASIQNILDEETAGNLLGLINTNAADISTIDGALTSHKNDDAAHGIDKMLGVKNATITTTWTGSSAPYTQTVTVSGMLSTQTPVISPVYSATLATALLQKEAWNMVGKIITNNGSITVTCFEDKPITAIPIQIKGV